MCTICHTLHDLDNLRWEILQVFLSPNNQLIKKKQHMCLKLWRQERQNPGPPHSVQNPIKLFTVLQHGTVLNETQNTDKSCTLSAHTQCVQLGVLRRPSVA